jgi:hypothetical protein
MLLYNYQSCRSVALISIKLNNERNLRIIIHDVSHYIKYLENIVA